VNNDGNGNMGRDGRGDEGKRGRSEVKMVDEDGR
jgi:hypothetical protein